jgi:hypothetical protein
MKPNITSLLFSLAIPLGELYEYGAEKHGRSTWRTKSVEHHVAHAKDHLARWSRTDYDSGKSELFHAALRLLFACSVMGAGRRES